MSKGAASASEVFLRETLWYYYAHFDSFDQISYPLLYSTGVGEEADVIDVFRVSPEDATALIDESKDYDRPGKQVKKEAAEKKLAGMKLAFWRVLRANVSRQRHMWGRLDGAERVIAALVPADRALKDRVTEQAHRAIIIEEMISEDTTAAANLPMQRVVWEVLDNWDKSGAPC